MGSAVMVYSFWPGSALRGNRGLWLLFVVFYGIFAGGYNALFPTTIREVFGMQAYASVNRFIYHIVSEGWGPYLAVRLVALFSGVVRWQSQVISERCLLRWSVSLWRFSMNH